MAPKYVSIRSIAGRLEVAPTDEGTDDTPEDTTPEAFQIDVSKMTPKDAADAIDKMNDHLAEVKKSIDDGTALISESNEYIRLVGLRNDARTNLNTMIEGMTGLDDVDPGGVESPGELNSEDSGEGTTDETNLENQSTETTSEDGSTTTDEVDTDAVEERANELVTAAMKKIASRGVGVANALKLSDTVAAKPATASVAPMVASKGKLNEGVQPDAGISDEGWAAMVADFMGSTTGRDTLDLGGWDQWAGETKKIASSDNRMSIMQTTGRGYDGAHKIDPKTAAPCEPGCTRRQIADCGNMADPLDVFTQFPCDRGSVEYFTAISLSEVEDGITVWDDGKQAAYDSAYAAWRTSLTDGSTPAQQAAFYASLVGATKQCARVACQTGVSAAVLPIAICLDVTNEVGYSNPEAVLAYRSAISRLMLRRRNAQRRLMLQSYASHYTVDACAPQYHRLGAAPVIFQALSEALCLGVIRERLEEAGYVVGMDWGLMKLIINDIVKSDKVGGISMDDAMEFTHGLPIIPLYEGADAAAIQHPYQGVTLAPAGPPAGAAPQLPAVPASTWQVEVFRPADFDTISVPQISLSATRGPSEAKQNIEMNLFLETFEGLLKPGCNPNFTLNFVNMEATGVRAAPIAVANSNC